LVHGNNPYFSSAEAFKTALRIGDRKVCRQAKKAVKALDRLKACANADWRAMRLTWLSSPRTLFPAPRQLQSPSPNNLLRHDS
jgi:hypothetical protein